MKKFVVLLVVVALTAISGLAFAAAEVSVSGEMGIRSRDFSNMDFNDQVADGNATQQKDTQSRVRLDVNAKAGDVKGKISIWNDFDTWGRFEKTQADATGYSTPGFLSLREAWINFNLPGIPVNVTGGHQLLALGNEWFFRSKHYGSDAWVVANVTGNNTAALVNVKFSEGTNGLGSTGTSLAKSDDKDAYVLLNVFKINDNNTVGIDITDLKDRTAKAAGVNVDLQNIGVNYNGKLGPVALKAQVDVQMGKKTTAGAGNKDNTFAGNEIVIQGSIPMDPVTINFTVAQGSGQDLTKPATAANGNDITLFQTALDIDPHYTFLYEYKLNTAAGAKNTGFANTTAIGVGASFAATKSLTIGADVWMLQSTEKVAVYNDATKTTNDLGQEIDVKVNWALAENLSWNWNLGMFSPGDGMGKDSATGIQGILSFKF